MHFLGSQPETETEPITHYNYQYSDGGGLPSEALELPHRRRDGRLTSAPDDYHDAYRLQAVSLTDTGPWSVWFVISEPEEPDILTIEIEGQSGAPVFHVMEGEQGKFLRARVVAASKEALRTAAMVHNGGYYPRIEAESRDGLAPFVLSSRDRPANEDYATSWYKVIIRAEEDDNELDETVTLTISSAWWLRALPATVTVT